MKTVAGQVCVSKSRGAIIADNTWSCVRQIAEFKLTPEHAEQQWETLLMESELQELSSLFIHCRWSGKLPEVRSVFIIHFFLTATTLSWSYYCKQKGFLLCVWQV